MTLQQLERESLQSKIESIKWFINEGFSKEQSIDMAGGIATYGPVYKNIIEEELSND